MLACFGLQSHPRDVCSASGVGLFLICASLFDLAKQEAQWMLAQSNAFGIFFVIIIILEELQNCLKQSLIWSVGKIVHNLGNGAKEMIFVTCLGCFSALAIHLHCPLALLFYVRFRWVMSMRFLTKSVFIPKEKAFSCQLICLFLVWIVSYNLAVANWNLCSVSLICFIICIISHCLCVVFNVSVGLF